MASDTVQITRTKVTPTPGRGGFLPWKWLYTVSTDGEKYSGEGVGWARRKAKEKANGRPVIETWNMPEQM